MDWSDSGLIVGLRRHGESSVILEAMTAARGRHFGMVRGGRSRAMQAMLQPGNRVNLAWRARLEEHLGLFVVEPERLRAGRLMGEPAALHGLNWLSALLRLLPERDPHPHIFTMADTLADCLDDSARRGELMVRFELAVLGELGFGLDLSACAATGAMEDLAYVSPKSGRAVSRVAGAPWAERLLALPDFLLRSWGDVALCPDALAAGLRLTEFFLNRDVFAPRGLLAPDARARFCAQALLDISR